MFENVTAVLAGNYSCEYIERHKYDDTNAGVSLSVHFENSKMRFRLFSNFSLHSRLYEVSYAGAHDNIQILQTGFINTACIIQGVAK